MVFKTVPSASFEKSTLNGIGCGVWRLRVAPLRRVEQREGTAGDVWWGSGASISKSPCGTVGCVTDALAPKPEALSIDAVAAGKTQVFVEGFTDACLMTQNMVNAAERLAGKAS